MSPQAIAALRKNMGLSQPEFAQLFGVHFITVSKWERGASAPTAYQLALLEHFHRTVAAKQQQASEEIKKLLVGAGVVAALAWLFAAR
jgi:DNA-binding transcriptional regulator YiaG